MMSRYYVIGIDPAPASTGVVVRSVPSGMLDTVNINSADLVDTKIFKIADKVQALNDYAMFDSFNEVAEEVVEYIGKWNEKLAAIGIESPLSTAVKSPITWGAQIKYYSTLVNKLHFRWYFNQVVFVTSSAAKYCIGLAHHSKKVEVIPQLENYGYKFDYSLKRTREDIADAIAISYAAESVYKQRVATGDGVSIIKPKRCNNVE